MGVKAKTLQYSTAFSHPKWRKMHGLILVIKDLQALEFNEFNRKILIKVRHAIIRTFDRITTESWKQVEASWKALDCITNDKLIWRASIICNFPDINFKLRKISMYPLKIMQRLLPYLKVEKIDPDKTVPVTIHQLKWKRIASQKEKRENNTLVSFRQFAVKRFYFVAISLNSFKAIQRKQLNINKKWLFISNR